MTDPTQLDADVRRYLQLDAQKADLEIEMSDIKSRLRNLGIGQHAAPCGVTVAVAPNRRFSADEAERIVPPEVLMTITSTVIDAKKAKALLPPALYEAAMLPIGDPRVSIK